MFPNFTKSLKEAEGCISQLNIVNCGAQAHFQEFCQMLMKYFQEPGGGFSF